VGRTSRDCITLTARDVPSGRFGRVLQSLDPYAAVTCAVGVFWTRTARPVHAPHRAVGPLGKDLVTLLGASCDHGDLTKDALQDPRVMTGRVSRLWMRTCDPLVSAGSPAERRPEFLW
jgi:hypothetical protein